MLLYFDKVCSFFKSPKVSGYLIPIDKLFIIWIMYKFGIHSIQVHIYIQKRSTNGVQLSMIYGIYDGVQVSGYLKKVVSTHPFFSMSILELGYMFLKLSYSLFYFPFISANIYAATEEPSLKVSFSSQISA